MGPRFFLRSSLLALGVACQAPAPAPEGCPEGELDDGGACVPVECGSGTWGNLDTGEDTIFVDAGADAGGDGTEAAPFGSIGEGLDAAEVSGASMVAVAAGSYAESVVLGKDLDGLHLAGRCSEMVVLQGDPEVVVDGIKTRGDGSWTVSGMTITGFTPGVYQHDGRLLLREIQIVDNLEAGVWSRGENISVHMDQVLISGTRPSPQDVYGLHGIGALIVGVNEATLTLENSELSDNRYTGLYLYFTNAEINSSLITGTRAESGWGGGFGLDAEYSEVAAVDLRLTDNINTSLYALESDIVLSGGTIGETGADETGTYGFGVYCSSCALSLSSTELYSNIYAAVWMRYASATFDSVVIEGTHPNVENLATGLMSLDSSFIANDSTWTANQNDAIVAISSDLTLTRVLVEGTTQVDDFGEAVALLDQSTLLATDVRIEDTDSAGLFVDTSDVDWTGGGIWDTHLGSGDFGYAIQIGIGGTMLLRNATLDGNYLGIAVIDATLDIKDTAILNTRSGLERAMSLGIYASDFSTVNASNVSIVGTDGSALTAENGGSVSCISCTIQDSACAGVIAYLGGQVSLGPDTTITDTRADDATLGGGVGVLVASDLPSADDEAEAFFGPVTLTLNDVQISGSALSSVYIAGPGSYSIIGSSLEGGTDDRVSAVYPYGNAVFAVDGVGSWDAATSTGLLLRDNTLSAAPGGAVFLHGSSATLEDNRYSENVLDLLQQGCGDGLTLPDGWEEAETNKICAEYDRQVERLDFYVYFPTLDPEE